MELYVSCLFVIIFLGGAENFTVILHKYETGSLFCVYIIIAKVLWLMRIKNFFGLSVN